MNKIQETVKKNHLGSRIIRISFEKDIEELRYNDLSPDFIIPSDVNSLVKSTIDKFGRVDILINNAGFLIYKNLINTSDKEWDKIIQTNLKGTFLFCKTVLPHMIKKIFKT